MRTGLGWLKKGYSSGARERQSARAKRRRERTHLPPAVAIKVISGHDLDALARTKGNLIFVLRGKIVSSVDVFHHGKCCERGGLPCEMTAFGRFRFRGKK